MEGNTTDQQDIDACKADTARWTRVTTAIEFLKAAMITRPALALHNYNYLVRTDASDFAIGATLRKLQIPEGDIES